MTTNFNRFLRRFVHLAINFDNWSDINLQLALRFLFVCCFPNIDYTRRVCSQSAVASTR